MSGVLKTVAGSLFIEQGFLDTLIAAGEVVPPSAEHPNAYPVSRQVETWACKVLSMAAFNLDHGCDDGCVGFVQDTEVFAETETLDV